MRNKFKAAVTLLSYFFNKPAITKLVNYRRLIHVLSPFLKAGYITRMPFTAFIYPYLSLSLNKTQRIGALICHYSFLSAAIPADGLKQIFLNGLECFSLTVDDVEFKIAIKKNTVLESEGPLSLCFTVNGDLISILSLSFVPGHIFNYPDDTILYITHLQRYKTPDENNQKFLSAFRKIHPSTILLKATEGIALGLGIDKIAAINTTNQLSGNAVLDQKAFENTYNNFWHSRGGVYLNDNYVFNLPIPETPILEIKQKHRNKTLKRRAILNNISHICYQNVRHIRQGKV